jgi:hypothetical protein
MPQNFPNRIALAGSSILIAASLCLAGTPQSWDSLPKAVQDAVLANGGKAGSVDKEDETVDGKALYEASVKGADGVAKDLDITEDGKLVETKTDDAADAAQERADRAEKLLKDAKFSHPTEITNPYLPLSLLKHDVLEGNEDGKKVHIDRIPRPDVHKVFKVAGQDVEAAAFEDRETEDGELAEVTIDYFAQDDAGNVYYFGEDVDEYKDGKVVGHEGGWLLGKDTPDPGVILPAEITVGDKFRSEDVSSEISEKDEIVSLSEDVTVPAGTFVDCVKVREQPAGENPEYKYCAKGVGVVREVPVGGDVVLITHQAK